MAPIHFGTHMALDIRQFIFDAPSRRGSSWPALKMTAKRYRIPNPYPPKDGLTLLFFHCIGAHKEQWEIAIAFLFKQQMSLIAGQCKIREAWAFDWPTHGDAALLNRELLQKRTDSVSVYDWVPGVVQFVRSEHVRGHRLVLCGHSAGASTAVHTAVEFYPNLDSVGITSVILVESTLVTRELFDTHFKDQMAQMDSDISATSLRRDRWISRQDALSYFQKRFPWNMWDPRVVRSFIEHGLYELADGTVGLKCDKKHEAEGFPDVDPHFEGIIRLSELCHALPVHVVWGTRNDRVPEFIQDSLSDVAEGRPTASVTKVKRCGHMIVQEQPLGLAQVIHDILSTMPSILTERSRL
ncbi:alpha/beta-hydrolase [Macrolepiota fuliginosa MF-IS2]|uniref:Alpha/beta-hydrolase n=1 Tax=Macrolepiota fuliginosa MF-IS2 TaxID=1400762 RepID=A0A9P5XEW3_9AGAR|nr:alpha/beta-hydrolase [Macrolepiota fuliginosa MF-IS2]